MKLKLLILVFVFFSLFNKAAWAENQAGASAMLKNSVPQSPLPKNDLRIFKLEKFLAPYNTPFGEEEIITFLRVADQNQLDWRLLPAITGIESAFGQLLPANSYNPFGWGIYGNNVTRFTSYEEAIETVAEGISQRYPYEDMRRLASTYCPPNAYVWANQVASYMEQIEDTPIASQELLAISL